MPPVWILTALVVVALAWSYLAAAHDERERSHRG